MTKYRYARSNGQFLPSKFGDAVEAPTDLSFRTDKSYDLTNKFVTGTNSIPNSFITDHKLSGYDSSSTLLAWWRLTDNGTGIVKDSSVNRWNATQTNPTRRPSFDLGDTPSGLIQQNSFFLTSSTTTDEDFLVISGSETTVVTNVTSSAPFSFGDGTNDRPFSIAAWVKQAPLTGSYEHIVTKARYGTSGLTYPWEYTLTSVDGVLQLVLYCTYQVSVYRGKKTSEKHILSDTWTHVAATYDGRAGNAAEEGINLYINGTAVPIEDNNLTPGAANYDAMNASASPVIIGGREGGDNTDIYQNWSGNIAEVAMWSSALSAATVKSLYEVSIAGAYRLVRDYSQVSPDNDTRVLGIATESKGFDTTSWPPDIMNQFVQGINVVSHEQLSNYTAFKLRPNSSFLNTLRGKDVPRIAFNEEIATTSFPAGKAKVVIGGDGKLSQRLSHEREQRDLGQSAVYDNGEAFVDTLDLSPTGIINTHPLALVLPSQMVAQTSDELMDGAIEPLTLRETIDGSGIEGPFYSHTFRASLGGMTDPFRRSYLIVDGRDLDEPKKGAAPFLDSVESLGATDMPGAFSPDFALIEPYIDYLNDRDKDYTTNNVSTAVSHVLIHSASFVDDDDRTFDKMSAHGFIFDNDSIGIDSIAFGGLKK